MSSVSPLISPLASRPPTAGWGAVFALSLGAFALVASEFMPVSLLTPIAASLRISEGDAGQAIAVSGLFAVLTSLSLTRIVGRLDRKILLLLLVGLMVISGIIVAGAGDYRIFMIGRALIGVAIGGFWSLTAATAMRLVPDHQLPLALAVVNGGNALATVVAAPLGSFLGGLIGWRWAFFCVVPVAALVFLWQLISLPPMPVAADRRPRPLFALMARPVVACGMAATSIFFMGQFALFTYLRPFLELAAAANVSTLSLLLLVMGLAGFMGTVLIGPFLKNHLYRSLFVIPLVMAGLALALLAVGGTLPAIALLLAGWGLLATAAPVGWWNWLARTLPDHPEEGGGLMVAIIQLAITLGAGVGGLLFDGSGYRATFSVSALILALAALLALATGRLRATCV